MKISQINSIRLHSSLAVNIGITDELVDQLITLTNSDPIIQKNTRDLKRFKNKAVYKKWVKSGKHFYTLTNSENKLFGIIWFSLGKMTNESKESFTFSIRTYSPARGMGLSKEFMKISIVDFIKSETFKEDLNNTLWLSTLKDNDIAIKIYEKFGFKIILEDQDKVKMILEVNSLK